MSHVAHPTLSARSQLRAHWIVAISAVLALLAAAAVTLVLILDNGASTVSGSVARPQAGRPLRRPSQRERSRGCGRLAAERGSGREQHRGLHRRVDPDRRAQDAPDRAQRERSRRVDLRPLGRPPPEHRAGTRPRVPPAGAPACRP